jgi:hypothetical protein
MDQLPLLNRFRWPLVALLACGAGCGEETPPYGTVAGRVTLAGKPVSEGSVVFSSPETGVARMANLDPDGQFIVRSFDLPGLPVGEYGVAISPHRVSSGEFRPVEPAAAGLGMVIVPQRYREPETSGLVRQVEIGENKFDIPLEP